MRLSWNEVRDRAAVFAGKWQDAAYEKGETQSFYSDFFHIFDVERRSVARHEERVCKLDNSWGFIDLFWPGVLIVEQKSAGNNEKPINASDLPKEKSPFRKTGNCMGNQ